MPRYLRNTYAVAALETTYGTAPTFTNADGILMSEFVANFPREGQSRDLIRPYFGASEELVGVRRGEIKIVVEMAGSGAAGTAPAWGRLLRACNCAETITAGNRVEYNPVTNNAESLAMNFSNDGVRYALRGMKGSAKFILNAYERPRIEFNFTGFDVASAVAALVTPTLSTWQRPEVVSDANSSGFKIGSSYSAGSITGGTSLISRGMTFDIANKVEHMQLVGGEQIDITDREPVGTGVVELTQTDEVAWRTDMNANTLTSMSFAHGSAAGKKIIFHAPAIQRLNNQIMDYQGRAMTSFDMRVLPVSGNDEFRLVVA